MDFPFSRFKLAEYARHRAFAWKRILFLFCFCFLLSVFDTFILSSNCYHYFTVTELSLKAQLPGAAHNIKWAQARCKKSIKWFLFCLVGMKLNIVSCGLAFAFINDFFSFLSVCYILSTFCNRMPFFCRSFPWKTHFYLFPPPKMLYGFLMKKKSLWRYSHSICSWLENDSDLLNLYNSDRS